MVHRRSRKVAHHGRQNGDDEVAVPVDPRGHTHEPQQQLEDVGEHDGRRQARHNRAGDGRAGGRARGGWKGVNVWWVECAVA